MPATADPGAPGRLVFLHGFTQTHHHVQPIAELVAARLDTRPVLIYPDLPGHGVSGADRLDIDGAAAELASTTGRATHVGYSMGGRFALHTALVEESPVERIVLIGASPGIADDAERAERRRLDDERAARIERIGVPAFLDEWLAAPLFATLPIERADVSHRLRNTPAGLAHSLRTAGTGHQRSLWHHLDRIEIPVLILAGSLDTKFAAIGRAMAERLPRAEVAIVEGAGHAAHAERPVHVATIIATWLGRTGRP